MKYLVFFLTLAFSLNADWSNDWLKGIEACERKQWIDAKYHFDQSIPIEICRKVEI